MKIDKIQEQIATTFKKNSDSFEKIIMLLYMFTGSGKTKTSIDCLKSAYKKGDNIAIISYTLPAQMDIKKEFEKWWPNYKEEVNVDFLTYQWYYRERNNTDKLYNYNFVVIDEFHHTTPLFITNAFSNNDTGKIELPKHVISMTGTPVIDQEIIDTLFGTSSDTKSIDVFNYTVKEAVNDNTVEDYDFIPIGVELNEHEIIKLDVYNEKVFNSTNHRSRLIAEKYRKNFFSQVKEKEVKKLLNSLKSKTIIFCNSIEQARRLCEHSYHSDKFKVFNGKRVNLYPGAKKQSLKNLKSFNNGEINRLSAVNALDESVNIENLETGIIIQGNSEVRNLIQRIGRTVRKGNKDKPKIYYFYVKNTIDEYWLEKNMKFVT